MPRPRSANPSPAALRMRALRAARKAGVERSRSPAPRTFTNVPPIERTHEQTRMNVPETPSISGPEPRGSPMPPEVAEVMFGLSCVPISTPSPRGEPIQPLPEHQRPGFRGYRCYECPKEGFIEPKTLKDHLLKAHRLTGIGVTVYPSPPSELLPRSRDGPLPHVLRPLLRPPRSRGRNYGNRKQVVPKDEGWEKVPKPTHRELIEQGWTPAKGDDLIRDGWERVG